VRDQSPRPDREEVPLSTPARIVLEEVGESPTARFVWMAELPETSPSAPLRSAAAEVPRRSGTFVSSYREGGHVASRVTEEV
jgi:hypothetical protein